MSTAKASNKKSRTEPQRAKSDHLDLDLDLDLSNDLKGIMSALHQIREKAHNDGLKKNEETISSVAAEVRSVIDDLKSKVEKDRQSFAKSLSKSSKECENCLKTETAKFQALYEKFCKDQANHLQALKGSSLQIPNLVIASDFSSYYKAFLCKWIVIVINNINSIR
ncbi:PREDICTED: DNA ligase [Prunus dulcis]|uniref:PREDICTED: DNA ligase n=1 Tax=Prunus dulcis TaxID=3755 RepID=A0A5E4F8W3_PRUDU|nr:PREDICTED: DNA ligase [Prunus dulcis]